MTMIHGIIFDLDGVLPDQMSSLERERLNEYHKKVYENISPYLDEKEREWLYNETKEMLYG